MVYSHALRALHLLLMQKYKMVECSFVVGILLTLFWTSTGVKGSAAVPVNVSATALSSTVISVQWSGLFPCRLVNGLIVKYRVQYRAQSGGMVESKEVTGNWSSGAETELTGLTPSTYYPIEVAAVNEEGDVGVYSHPVTVKTMPANDTSLDVSQNNSAIIGAAAASLGVVIASIAVYCVCSRSSPGPGGQIREGGDDNPLHDMPLEQPLEEAYHNPAAVTPVIVTEGYS